MPSRSQEHTVYYALYPGDFLADITDLGNSELGIYTRLTLYCYQHRRPLPGDLSALCRIAMALTPEEQSSLVKVLERYFKPGALTKPDGTIVRVYRKNRIEQEIEAADQRYQAAVQRTEHARAAKLAKAAKNIEESKPVSVTESVTGSVTESVTTSLTGGEPELELELDKELEPKPETTKTVASTSRGAQLVRKAVESGLEGINPRHAKIGFLCALGITDEEWQTAIDITQEASKGFAYALAVAENRHHEAQRAPAKPKESAWWLSEDATTAKAKEIGVSTRIGEEWPQFRERIRARLAEIKSKETT